MKKLTYRMRQWHRNRARREARKRSEHTYNIIVWHEGERFPALSLKTPVAPPTVLCLEHNPEETHLFLETARRRLLTGRKNPIWYSEPTRRHRSRVLAGFFDFGKISRISTSAALVLAAEYQRIADRVGPPPLINLQNWDQNVLFDLYNVGFFEVIGITEDNLDNKLSTQRDKMILKFISGTDTTELKKADEMLMTLADFISPGLEMPLEMSIPLVTAISEAMTNVRMHAYPTDHRYQYPHVNRWWVTGSADRISRVLTISIYDQGVSIPISYPKLGLPQQARAFIEANIGLTETHTYSRDALNIEAATKYGRTRSDEPHRGKGLRQIIEAVAAFEDGRAVILSRGGRFTYHASGTTERTTYTTSIGGTLIEWNVALPGASRENRK